MGERLQRELQRKAQGRTAKPEDLLFVEGGRDTVRTALGNSFEVTRLLIEHDADIEAKDDHGHTALYFAVGKESLIVARLLKDKGVSTGGIDLRWMDDQKHA